ncbi:MAG: glycosyltransferase [Woeseiaceae bacterium]|nr:glycosyltransferase [Woeseiaceae bacterium]
MNLRVTHVITGLNVGGAERSLLTLCQKSARAGLEASVVCLSKPGAISPLIEETGVPVRHLGLTSPMSAARGLLSVRSAVRSFSPHIVQGWMYHGNLAALWARPRSARVVWNVRQSMHRPDLFKFATRAVIRANAWLSRRADTIIYNSAVALDQHEAFGFSGERSVRIPNGVDLERFDSSAYDRGQVRQSFGLDSNHLVFICVGRVHAIKGHGILLDAAKRFLPQHPDARLMIVGRGADWASAPFASFADDEAVREQTILVGEHDDVPALLAASDVFVNASLTEGFPNAVAEAMATGLPVVATGVGDTAYLVDDCGRVVDSDDPEQLSSAMSDIAAADASERADRGARGRARVSECFSLDILAERYASLYRDLQTARP